MSPTKQYIQNLLLLLFFSLLITSCATTYYSAMEQVGVHKRDILVDRVENARDSQTEAQEQFKSALEQFGSVVKLKNTNLKQAYTKLDQEYNDCKDIAEEVSDRIDRIEAVASALFAEWQEELKLYDNNRLRESSRKQLQATKVRYKKMLGSMHLAEQSMDPVLRTFHDNVLFLKHNLNAQAIGSLEGEFSSLEQDIDALILKMNRAIQQSNTFIAQMENS